MPGSQEWSQAVDWISATLETTVQFRMLPAERVLLVEPTRRLRAEDFSALAATVDREAGGNGGLNGIVVHARRFPGWQNVGSLLRHVGFVRAHQQDALRVAVAANGKVATLAPRLTNLLVAADVRRFPWDQLDDAIAWAGSKPEPTHG